VSLSADLQRCPSYSSREHSTANVAVMKLCAAGADPLEHAQVMLLIGDESGYRVPAYNPGITAVPP